MVDHSKTLIWLAKPRHSLCNYSDKNNNKDPLPFGERKLDFHPLKLVGLHVVTIKCHQPAASDSIRHSATRSSLLLPSALAGHTGCHPSPPPCCLSLCLPPNVFLSISLFFARVRWPTLPHNLPNCLCHPALGFRSVSAELRAQCWQSSGPSEGRSNPGPPFCYEKALWGTKGQGLQFHSQAITRLTMVGEKNWHPRGCST